MLNTHLLRVVQDAVILRREAQGTLRQSYWLSLKATAVDFYAYGGLFLVLYLFRNSPILLGGVLGCLTLGASLGVVVYGAVLRFALGGAAESAGGAASTPPS